MRRNFTTLNTHFKNLAVTEIRTQDTLIYPEHSDALNHKRNCLKCSLHPG